MVKIWADTHISLSIQEYEEMVNTIEAVKETISNHVGDYDQARALFNYADLGVGVVIDALKNDATMLERLEIIGRMTGVIDE